MSSVTSNAQTVCDDMDTERASLATFIDTITPIVSPDGTGTYSTLVMLNLDDSNN